MLARCTGTPGRCGFATLQRPSFSSCCMTRRMVSITRLMVCFVAGLVGNNAVIIKFPDHGQILYALLGVDVENIRRPFAVGSVRMKPTVQQVFVLIACCPRLPHFLRRRISASNSYFSMIRSMVLGSRWMSRFFSSRHILRQPCVRKLRSLCSAMISARAASFSGLPRRWTKS